MLNNTLEWKEDVFLDIEQNDMAKDTKIVSLNLNKITEEKHVSVYNKASLSRLAKYI